MEPTSLRNTAPPRRERVFFGYVWLVVVAGAAAVAGSVPALVHLLPKAPPELWLMGLFAVAADALPLTTPGRRRSAALCPSICFSFAILLGWGIGPAVLVQAAAVTLTAWRLSHAPWRAAFNIGQYALAFAAAGALLALAPGHPLAGRAGRQDVLIFIGAALVWFVVNHLLVGVAVWLRFDGGLWKVLTAAIGAEVLSTFSLLSLSPVLVAAAHASPWLIPLVGPPLYAVFRMTRLSEEQRQLALLDPLTGLANRKALGNRVAEEITAQRDRIAAGSAPATQRLALLLLDLDRFKHVNDALGHGVGDRLLVEVGRRLTRFGMPGDLVARLGGDEFAVLVPRLPSAEAAREVARRVSAALADPVHLDGMPLDVGSSIGIALYPDHGADCATLLQHADVAMYDAKTRADSVAVYAPESDHNSAARLSLLGDLRRSLETPGFGEIAMYYQPQVAIAGGDVVGVEALLRWTHPTRGIVDPEELIRIAEHSAVMRLLTFRVLDEVVGQLAAWNAAGVTLRAAVNVSVRDLHTGEIVGRLAELLSRHQVRPSQLLLEITEGALMADPRRVLATIGLLDKLGVGLSLDDFGTGYSSMQHLRRLPLSEVKIDRSFVLGMARDDDDAAVVRSIIELAGALGLRVVAEGVEDERTWRRLGSMGCHVAQGWFYARPMPADDLPRWLTRYRPPRILRALTPHTPATAHAPNTANTPTTPHPAPTQHTPAPHAPTQHAPTPHPATPPQAPAPAAETPVRRRANGA